MKVRAKTLLIRGKGRDLRRIRVGTEFDIAEGEFNPKLHEKVEGQNAPPPESLRDFDTDRLAAEREAEIRKKADIAERMAKARAAKKKEVGA